MFLLEKHNNHYYHYYQHLCNKQHAKSSCATGGVLATQLQHICQIFPNHNFLRSKKQLHETRPNWVVTGILLMEEILHQLIGNLSHYLQGFIDPRWCRISCINRMIHLVLWFSPPKTTINQAIPRDPWCEQVAGTEPKSTSGQCVLSINFFKKRYIKYENHAAS